jgi:hypothetical protein
VRQYLWLAFLLISVSGSPVLVSTAKPGVGAEAGEGANAGGVALSGVPGPGRPQGSSPEASQKLALEIEQLKLQNQKLTADSSSLNQPWFVALSAFLGALIATGGAWWAGRRGRFGTFDQVVLVKRLEKCQDVMATTEPLALYFPEAALTKDLCKRAGTQLRTCYFSGIGIFVSKETRDWYFSLAEALTRAAVADAIDVPALDDYSKWVSESRIDEYRQLLRLEEVDKEIIVDWRFGQTTQRGRSVLYKVLKSEPVTSEELDLHPEVARAREDQLKNIAAAQLFRDFVLLQNVASRLRSALAKDLGGRRRPA